MRTALSERPDPASEAPLVRRMAEAARIAQQEAGDATQRAARRSAPKLGVGAGLGSRLRLAGKLAVAVGAFVLAMAGLAVAGVTLPQPARSAFDKLGLHLPNQSQNAASDQHAADADENAAPTGEPASPSPGDRGKSKAAHQRVLDARARRLAAGHGRKLGYSKGKAIGLNGATPPGQTSSGPLGHYSAPANAGEGHSSNSHARSHRGSRGSSGRHSSGRSQSQGGGRGR